MFLSRTLGAQMVKNLPAMQETLVGSLGWEDPLEKGVATCSCVLAWRIPWIEEPGGLQSRVEKSQTQLSDWHLGEVAEVLRCLEIGPAGVETATLGGMPTPVLCLSLTSTRGSTVPWFSSNPVQFWKRKLVSVELIYPCTTSGWTINWFGTCPSEEFKSTVLA